MPCLINLNIAFETYSSSSLVRLQVLSLFLSSFISFFFSQSTKEYLLHDNSSLKTFKAGYFVDLL